MSEGSGDSGSGGIGGFGGFVNVRAVIESIRANSPALSDAAIVGAVYHLGTGEVHFLDPAPSD